MEDALLTARGCNEVMSTPVADPAGCGCVAGHLAIAGGHENKKIKKSKREEEGGWVKIVGSRRTVAEDEFDGIVVPEPKPPPC